MIIRNISEVKAQFSALIEAVHEVIIGKADKPIARLVGYQGAAGARRPGALHGQIRIADDFDELPPDLAEAFGTE